MSNVELFVDLKIPDTTAITTLHTIERMGYKDVKNIKRETYYKFIVEGDSDKFAKKVGKVDVLVNANKNKFTNSIEKEDFAVHILVKDIDCGCDALLHTLKGRLGLKEIERMETGFLWTLYIDSPNAADIALEIAKKLLYNENYQDIEVL